MWNFTLVIFWSLAAESSSLHATMFLANCLITTVQLLSVFFFLSFFFFAGCSKRQESKQGERSQREQKQRKGTKQQRWGAPFKFEPDGGTRQSHQAEEEGDRRGKRSVITQTHLHLGSRISYKQTEEKGR